MAILSIDQGTTGTTVILVDHQGNIQAKTYREFQQIYPQPGWVEHSPEEIWRTVVDCVEEISQNSTATIEAVGITNQRETTIIWDAITGEPVYNAIVWQCRRTASACKSYEPHRDLVKSKTGLPLDAYFSASKAQWILRNADLSAHPDLRFGTIDTWLIWKLTGGQVHATDYTNASRTMLFNIREKKWDPELCDLFNIPLNILPVVKKSADDFGRISAISVLQDVPIRGVAGDQQASLFGQQCFERGKVKNTYGTGCFLMMNTGSKAIESTKGLITTLAANPQGDPCYALEGSIFIAGAAIQWLRDELGLLDSAKESEAAARSVNDNGSVYLVPAFAGLGAPYWDMEARGLLTGLTRGSNKNHIIRASLEAMAYQTHDVIEAMELDTGMEVQSLAVDGGATVNEFLMQFQSDILNIDLIRAQRIETTALGVAYLAGLAIRKWTEVEIKLFARSSTEYSPQMIDELRQKYLGEWKLAIRRARFKR